MLIDTDTMIPWKSNDHNENLLVDFLNQGCRWQGPYSYGPKEEFFVAYAEFCNQRGTTSDSRGMTETRLQRLGHEVTRDGIRGVFVRTGAEAPAATSDSPKLPGGSAALSMPHEMAILPGDDAKTVAEKLAYNAQFHPKPKPEVVFDSAVPAI